MRIKILGIHGGEMKRHKPSCVLIDDRLIIDAGAITCNLDVEDIVCIDHVLITHSHLDHIKDLAMMADLLVGKRKTPVVIHTTAQTARTIFDHFFNNLLWPDFTTIPTKDCPVFKVNVIEPGKLYRIGPHRVRCVPVNHPVECVGYVVSRKGVTIVYGGDTGPTEELWRQASRLRNLKALFLETSFPNHLQDLARVSGHLTPRTMTQELTKLKQNGVPIYIHHLKPAYHRMLLREIRAINNRNIHIPRLGTVIEID